VDNLVSVVVDSIQRHQSWGILAVFALGFAESFAFISLLVPATAILIGVGGLLAAAQMNFWPIWLAATLGAVTGDWLAYALAVRVKSPLLALPPMSSHPELVSQAVGFFKRWGLLAVFVGRFFGPLRALVPIVAGLSAMPWFKFQIANVASGVLWAFGILTPGFLSMRWLIS
jgi:membrane protein DedA with SNARE-associated domain